jgi:tRNA-intron endonuclease
MEPISAIFTFNGVIIPSINEANSLYQNGYGSMLKENRILNLQPSEVLYLLEHQKISVIDEESKVRLFFQELVQKYSEEDKDIWTKYVVYRDLRNRGFTVKEGNGPSVDFLVYERGSYGKKMPRYRIYTVWEGSSEPVESLGKILDESTNKNQILRLAVVDRRGEIIYYTLSDMEF